MKKRNLSKYTCPFCIVFFIIIFIAAYRYLALETVKQARKDSIKTDSLSLTINRQALTIDSLNKVISAFNTGHSQITGIVKHFVTVAPSPIVLYEPFNLTPELRHQRPKISSNTFLCIPAAYTDLHDFSIHGLFIEKGIRIKNERLTGLKGICIIKTTGIEILHINELDDKLLFNIKKNEYSLFQQSLLVYNYRLVEYGNFNDYRTKRRALAIKDNKLYVCESSSPVFFKDFQRALVNAGIKSAIYTDMGSWSEGWYRDYRNNINYIGDNFKNTHRQSNWFVLTRN